MLLENLGIYGWPERDEDLPLASRRTGRVLGRAKSSLQGHAEPRLFEVVVRGEGLVNGVLLHENERSAVRERPVLVQTFREQLQAEIGRAHV